MSDAQHSVGPSILAQLSVRRGREAVGHHWKAGKPLIPWPPADGRPHPGR